MVLSKRDWGAVHSSARTVGVTADRFQRVSGILEPRLTLPSTTLLSTMICELKAILSGNTYLLPIKLF